MRRAPAPQLAAWYAERTMTPQDQQRLAKPFDRVFATEDFAVSVRELLSVVLEAAGVDGPDDPRLATSVFRDKLHVNVGNWLVASLLSRKDGPTELGLLLRQDHGLADWRTSKPFTNDPSEPDVILAYLPYDQLIRLIHTRSEELHEALRVAAAVARRRFEGWAGSPYRHAHVPWMAHAYFDERLLRDVIREGLPERDAVHVHVVTGATGLDPDDEPRTYRLAPRANSESQGDLTEPPSIRRGDVVVHVADHEARSAGVVMAAAPVTEVAGHAGADARPELASVDAILRVFRLEPHEVRELPLPLEQGESKLASDASADVGSPAFEVPDEAAIGLLDMVLDNSPNGARDFVTWAKGAIESRAEARDGGRRRLPEGPITDRLLRGAARVVKLAPGRGGVLWDDFLESGVATVGWDDVGDLRSYSDFDTFLATFKRHYPYGGSRPAATKKARETWTMRELEPGDLIVANRGISEILGVGEVVEPGYEWSQDRDSHRHVVHVRWDARYRVKIPPQRYWAVVTVLDLEPAEALRLLKGDVDDGVTPSGPRVRLLSVPSGETGLRDTLGESAVGDRLSLPVGEHKANADLEVGDALVLWQAGDDGGLHGLGEVVDSPREDPDTPWSSRSIEIRIKAVLAEPIPSSDVAGDQALAGLEVLQAPNRYLYVVDEPEWTALQELFLADVEPTSAIQPAYSLGDVADATGMDHATLERWIRAIHRKGQAILYGPPGTGKTYVAKELAKHLVANADGFVKVLQFHAATAYEDFIQGLRPEIDANGNLSYVLAPGGFLKFVREARARSGVSVLILDEINRADLARVFGELMYLLEYRDEQVALAAGGKMLSVPRNVRILGTMNTADRSVALVDHALRRRFAFLRLQPDLVLLKRWHQGSVGETLASKLVVELERLHVRIDDPHLALGISYFLVKDLPLHLPDIWRMEIEPYLEELFFDEPDPLGDFAWEVLAARLGMS